MTPRTLLIANALISLVIVAGAQLLYDRQVIRPARTIGVVDLAEVYRVKEDEFTRRLTAAHSDEERQATLQMARHLAALPAEALARIKQLQRFAQSNGLDATLEQEALSLGQCFTSEEHRAAVARFLSRKPR